MMFKCVESFSKLNKETQGEILYRRIRLINGSADLHYPIQPPLVDCAKKGYVLY